MGILKQITATEYREIRLAPEGHEYHTIPARIRRVNSAAVLDQGTATLVASMPTRAKEQPGAAMSAEETQASVRAMYAFVAAGLAETSRDGGVTWEAEDLTPQEATRLPVEVVAHVCEEVVAFSLGRGEVDKALASFRSADAGDAGRAGKALPHGPGNGDGVEPRKARRGHARNGSRDDGGRAKGA